MWEFSKSYEYIQHLSLIKKLGFNCNSCVGFNPFKERSNSCKSCMHSNLTSKTWPKTCYSNLSVFSIFIQVFKRSSWVSLKQKEGNYKEQRLLLSYITSGLSISTRNADISMINVDGELKSTGSVGDGVHSGISQNGADAVCRICWLSPTTDLHIQVEPGGVPLRVGWQADWSHVI